MPPKVSKDKDSSAGASTVKDTSTGPVRIAYSPAEAKKLCKLLKASDRGKRLEAIATAGWDHEYILKGGCLLPLLESLVPKKKTEDIVRAAADVLLNYLVPTGDSESTPGTHVHAALQEAAAKPNLYRPAEVLSNLLGHPEPEISWTALKCLRALTCAATSTSSFDDVITDACKNVLLAPGEPVQNLCELLATKGSHSTSSVNLPWPGVQLLALKCLYSVCEMGGTGSICTVIENKKFLGAVLRCLEDTDQTPPTAYTVPPPGLSTQESSLKLLALASAVTECNHAFSKGCVVWDAVMQILTTYWTKVVTLALPNVNPVAAAPVKGKDAGPPIPPGAAARPLESVARCCIILKILAVHGVDNERLHDAIYAMRAVLGLPGLSNCTATLPDAASSITHVIEALGVIACIGESQRVEVCGSGAVPIIVSLMAPAWTQGAKDCVAYRGLRRVAEKCLFHLLTSGETFIPDPMALAPIPTPPPGPTGKSVPAAASAPVTPTVTPAVTPPGGYLPAGHLLEVWSGASPDAQNRIVRLIGYLTQVSKEAGEVMGIAGVPLLLKVVSRWVRKQSSVSRPGTAVTHTPTPVTSAQDSRKSQIKPEGVERRTSAGKISAKGKPGTTPSALDPPGWDEAVLENDADVSATNDVTAVTNDECLTRALLALRAALVGDKGTAVASAGAEVSVVLADVIASGPITAEDFVTAYVTAQSEGGGLSHPWGVIDEGKEENGEASSHSSGDQLLRNTYGWRTCNGYDRPALLPTPRTWSWDGKLFTPESSAENVPQVPSTSTSTSTSDNENLSAEKLLAGNLSVQLQLQDDVIIPRALALEIMASAVHSIPVQTRGTALCIDILSVDVHESSMNNNILLGKQCVPEAEEFVHENLKREALKFLTSLLRKGGEHARRTLMTVCDTHRGGWRNVLVGKAEVEGVEIPLSTPWTPPTVYMSWDLSPIAPLPPLLSALPYMRALSAILPTLANPLSPESQVAAAVEALTCLVSEDNSSGTQNAEDNDAHIQACTPLGDILAGTAISMGALVPLVSVAGCVKIENESIPDKANLAKTTQDLVTSLIRRGSSRTAFWARQPALPAVDETAPTAKSSKTGAKKPAEKTTTEKPTAETDVIIAPPALGRPDPNGGPTRLEWAKLLDMRFPTSSSTSSSATPGVAVNDVELISPLLLACSLGAESLVLELLEAGASACTHADSEGQTALMYALAHGSAPGVLALLKNGADINAVDKWGDSALKFSYACPPPGALGEAVRGEGKKRIVRSTSSTQAHANHPSPGGVHKSSLSKLGSGSFHDNTVGETFPSRNNSGTRDSGLSLRKMSAALTAPHFRVSFGGTAEGNGPGSASSSPQRGRRGSSGTRRRSSSFSRSAERSLAHHVPASDCVVVHGDGRLSPLLLQWGADPLAPDQTHGACGLHWSISGVNIHIRVLGQRVRLVTRPEKMDPKSLSNMKKKGSWETAPSTTVAEKHLDEGHPEESVNFTRREGLKHLLGTPAMRGGGAMDVADHLGMTALHRAVLAGRNDLVPLLLEAGASPCIIDKSGCLPLHYVCLVGGYGAADMCNDLVSAGEGRSVTAGKGFPERRGLTNTQRRAIDVENLLSNAYMEARCPQTILQQRAVRIELLNYVTKDGFVPLHYCCHVKAHSVISHSKASIATAYTASGMTDGEFPPCAEGERLKVLTWLLSQPGIDVRHKSPTGATPLHIVTQCASTECGVELISPLITAGVSIDALERTGGTRGGEGTPTDCAGMTALHCAIRRGDAVGETIALELLRCGVSPTDPPDSQAPPPLHLACVHAPNRDHLIQELANRASSEERSGPFQTSTSSLSDEGVTVYGASPLHLLVGAGGSVSSVKALIEAGAPVGKLSDSPEDGESPLHVACSKGAVDIVETLLSYPGASNWINMKSTAGFTPLHSSIGGGEWGLVKMLCDNAGFDAKILLEVAPDSLKNYTPIITTEMALLSAEEKSAPNHAQIRGALEAMYTALGKAGHPELDVNYHAEPHERFVNWYREIVNKKDISTSIENENAENTVEQ